TTRASDVAGRYGGEEFCVLMRDCGENEAGHFATRLVATVAAAPVAMPDGCEAELTASAGYAGGRSAGAGAAAAPVVREVMAQADSALYEAKRAGRNRAVAARGELMFAGNRVATLSEGLLSV
ncbi:MAG TPA: diguanylate cyclase, partial [Burkholderiaceae bacterium]|nr:diguanylate cyclase [Burkholderiaceae bacterium]